MNNYKIKNIHNIQDKYSYPDSYLSNKFLHNIVPNKSLKAQKQINFSQLSQKQNNQKLSSNNYKNFSQEFQFNKKHFENKSLNNLPPINASLPIDSDKNLINYRNKIYKLSDKVDLNKKLFIEYNNNKQKNIDQNKPNKHSNEVYDYNNFFIKNYDNYNNVYKQLNNYNKYIEEQNLRNQRNMNKIRAVEELKRIDEREKIFKYEKQRKINEDKKKQEYKEFLDNQVNEKFFYKFNKERSNIKNKELYGSVPQFLNKNMFIDVNPYNIKNYELGRSTLQNNPILNPIFNCNYNKYLFPPKQIN